jgi:hypothetical protein
MLDIDPGGGAGGGSGGNFLDLIEDADLRNSPSLEKFKGKSVDDFVRSHIELEKFQGNSIRIPGEDASPEEYAKIYDRLGRPKDPDGYSIKLPDNALDTEKEALGRILTKAHLHGLNDNQMKALYEEFNTISEEQNKALTDSMLANANKCEQQLRNEWGEDYDANADAVMNFVQSVEGLGDELDRAKVSNSPILAKVLLEMASLDREPDLKGGRIFKGGKDPVQRYKELNESKEFWERARSKNPDIAHAAAEERIALLKEVEAYKRNHMD